MGGEIGVNDSHVDCGVIWVVGVVFVFLVLTDDWQDAFGVYRLKLCQLLSVLLVDYWQSFIVEIIKSAKRIE